MLFRQGLPPHATYLFKHALVRDVAYGSRLRDQRQQLHGRIADVLAEHFPMTVEAEPEVIAHHYREAAMALVVYHANRGACFHANRKSQPTRISARFSSFWRDQGKQQQARELLAPVYGRFSEGFETRDLKEAKALLDELT